MSFALELSSVSKYFGEFRSLNNVSLTVQEGEFFALLGPNGAGKTTLINIIAGLSRASAGMAKVMGFDVVDQFRDARRSIGIVPQELVFDPFFSVRETLRFQSGYFGLKKNDDWIDELLHSLSLMDKADNNMRTLSGGMKRRVMVAQALVHRPPVIVLDEPTAGVDVELRQTLWKFIAGLNQKGHTILLTTHYLEEAETLCNLHRDVEKGRGTDCGHHAQPAEEARQSNPQHAVEWRIANQLASQGIEGQCERGALHAGFEWTCRNRADTGSMSQRPSGCSGVQHRQA